MSETISPIDTLIDQNDKGQSEDENIDTADQFFTIAQQRADVRDSGEQVTDHNIEPEEPDLDDSYVRRFDYEKMAEAEEAWDAMQEAIDLDRNRRADRTNDFQYKQNRDSKYSSDNPSAGITRRKNKHTGQKGNVQSKSDTNRLRDGVTSVAEKQKLKAPEIPAYLVGEQVTSIAPDLYEPESSEEAQYFEEQRLDNEIPTKMTNQDRQLLDLANKDNRPIPSEDLAHAKDSHSSETQADYVLSETEDREPTDLPVLPTKRQAQREKAKAMKEKYFGRNR